MTPLEVLAYIAVGTWITLAVLIIIIVTLDLAGRC